MLSQKVPVPNIHAFIIKIMHKYNHVSLVHYSLMMPLDVYSSTVMSCKCILVILNIIIYFSFHIPPLTSDKALEVRIYCVWLC